MSDEPQSKGYGWLVKNAELGFLPSVEMEKAILAMRDEIKGRENEVDAADNLICILQGRIEELEAENARLRKAAALLNSMVQSGESHSEQSLRVVDEAFGRGKG